MRQPNDLRTNEQGPQQDKQLGAGHRYRSRDRQEAQGREDASPSENENEPAAPGAVIGACQGRAGIPDHQAQRDGVEQEQERQRGAERDRRCLLARRDLLQFLAHPLSRSSRSKTACAP